MGTYEELHVFGCFYSRQLLTFHAVLSAKANALWHCQIRVPL